MVDNKEISDKNMENAVGGSADNGEGFRIEVEYMIAGTKTMGVMGEKHYMTHWVEPETTIETIETWTWQRCNATGAVCQTFYKGRPCDKTATVGDLGIMPYPYDKLDMYIKASGGDW